eukprot:1748454-Rhodomonas_salina.2
MKRYCYTNMERALIKYNGEEGISTLQGTAFWGRDFGSRVLCPVLGVGRTRRGRGGRGRRRGRRSREGSLRRQVSTRGINSEPSLPRTVCTATLLISPRCETASLSADLH